MNTEDFFALLVTRRSIRRYANRPVDPDVVQRLVEAACWAPSNHNRQGWKFLVFQDRDEIGDLSRRVREAVGRTIAENRRLETAQAKEILHFAGAFDEAPLVILAMHKKSPAIGRVLLASATSSLVSGEALSTAMAVQNLLLAAHALELGACVMTAPLLAADVWNSLADLPAGFEPTCLVCVGHPAETPPPPHRKSLQHVLEYRDRP